MVDVDVMSDAEGAPVGYTVSTRNTFLEVQNPNSNGGITQSAPPVYRIPADDALDNVPSTPEVWSVKPMPALMEEEDGKITADSNGPFPTLGLSEEPHSVITDSSEAPKTTLNSKARPFVPSSQAQAMPQQQLTTPHEKACADALKAALAELFREVGGVMFMLNRFRAYAFSVRLRMPAAISLNDAAVQVAQKKNYPQQFFVSETRAEGTTVQMTVHYNDGSFGKFDSWDICWDFVKKGECKRGDQCRWPHVPGAYFTISCEHPGQPR
jgi:hypothetical protein